MPVKHPSEIKVLLVDDEIDFRNILGFSLKRLGYQILSCSNGKEAFDLIRKNDIDIVVSDIHMPEGGGIELLNNLQDFKVHPKIILLLTGFTDLSTDEAHRKGVEAMFSKPFDCKLLHEAITRLFQSSENSSMDISHKEDARIRVNLQFQDSEMEGSIIDLGKKGMFIGLKNEVYPNVNDQISFSLNFDDHSILKGNGVVRWVRTQSTPHFPSGCGIEFNHLGDVEKRQVLDFVADQKPIFYV